jgi:signal transduction histidine kinase
MPDNHKTKAQLVSELAELRQRLAGWEAKDAEQTRVEQALHISEERYRGLFEHMSEGYAYCQMIFEHGAAQDFIYLSVNAAFETLTGLQDVIGKRVTEIIPGIRTADPELFETYARVALTGQPEQFEMFVKALPGWYSVSVYSPQPEFFIALFEVITARKQIAHTLERRVAHLTLLNDVGRRISNLAELESVLDTSARLVQRAFGYHHVALFTLDPAPGELVMKARAGDFSSLFPLDHRIKLGQGMVGQAGCDGETLLANDVRSEPYFVNFFPEVPTRSELAVPICTGTELIGVLDVQSRRLNAFDADDVMVLETVADQIAVAIKNAALYQTLQEELAERRQAEAALRQSQAQLLQSAKMSSLGVMAGGIAHELRNPLGIISANTGLLMEHPADLDLVGQCAEKILTATRRASLVIESLLKFARPQSERAHLVDLHAVMDGTLALLRHQMTLQQVISIKDYQSDLPRVQGTPELLQQVFINLILNACHAMPDGGTLTVRTRVGPEQQIEVWIEDTGIGIPPDRLQEIFEPFFTTRAPGDGVGLGLSISYNLIQQHQGTIEVKSQVGQGATFIIRFPRAEQNNV